MPAGLANRIVAGRTCSIAMMETTLAYPGMDVAATISSCASFRCGSDSALSGSPGRTSAGRYDHSRRVSPRSKGVNGTLAMVSWPASRLSRNPTAAPAIRLAVCGARKG